MSTFNKSIRPVASFVFESTENQTKPENLCLIPGHYNTLEAIFNGNKVHVSYADPSAIKAAGYSCAQVADDYNATIENTRGDGGKYPIKITSKSNIRYRDFLNYVKYSGLKVVKMRITDLTGSDSHEIFQQAMEVTQSSIGSKHGSDFVQLSSYINPANYLQTFIDIDLEKDERKLSLDETTLAFLTIPIGSKFQIDFTLAA
ncbi:MAG: hypothetical protein UHK44_07710 [Bacteroidaceae bacterium]|nr:hypothetical protein [Bacteroidaceae bacterium]